jgi:hypothetical protein
LNLTKKKVWNDPVWSNVIAGLIIAVIIFTGSYIFGFWPYIFELISPLNISVSIPLWVLIIVFFPLSYLSYTTFKSTFFTRKPDYVDYTCDHIVDIDWYWKWSKSTIDNREYEPIEFQSRCPKCKSILKISGLVLCINEKCDWNWPRMPSGTRRTDMQIFYSDLIEIVKVEIDRKIKTNEWKSG